MRAFITTALDLHYKPVLSLIKYVTTALTAVIRGCLNTL